MSDNTSNSKRIVKNTMMLYARMIVVTLVGLYTSRVVLQALGVEDYGLYNVVGGVVSLFAFLRTSMEKCTQRFLNVEMAKPEGNLSITFSVAVTIHIVLAAIALILLETLGLWFLNTYIQIPTGRELAANWVFQSVVCGLVFTILSIPYSASIIAHEKMGIFAIISVIDCFLKLGAAVLILKSNGDHLIYYGILMLFIHFLDFFFYYGYCKKLFKKIKFILVRDLYLYKEMLSYTTWALVGHAMILGTNQGNSILVNMFHGVTANAAMAVANQVNSHVLQLAGNFQTAFNPQITKSYANGDHDYLKTLVFSTSKISFYLLTIVSLPIMFNIDSILEVWLKEVPQLSGYFCILMLVSGIIQSMSAPLNFTVMASGQIKWFQIVTGLVFISDLFILYALFGLGYPPITVMYVKISIMIATVFVRLYFAHRIIPSISLNEFVTKVLVPMLFSTVLNVGFGLIVTDHSKPWQIRCISAIIIVAFSCVTTLLVGFDKKEKQMIKKIIVSKTKKK